MTHRHPATLLLGLTFLATTALASGAEVRIVPSLSVSQMHDDNVFATPAAQPDEVTRVTPGLAVERRSARLSLVARYEIAGEAYRAHPELSRVAARQDAALRAQWAVSERSAVSLAASYLDTQTPRELGALSHLEVGRRRGRRFSTGLLVTRRLSAPTAATVEHRFSRDRVVGMSGSDAHSVAAGLQRRFGRSDEGTLRYRVEHYAFGGEATGPILSHVVTFGWKRTVTPSARLEVEAGPRWTGNHFGVEVSAGMRHALPDGDASIEYVRSQTTALGVSEPVTVKGIRASVSHRLFGPLRFAAGPAVFRVGVRNAETTAFRFATELTWHAARHVAVSLVHQFGLQEGDLGWGTTSEIGHNTFTLAVSSRSARP